MELYIITPKEHETIRVEWVEINTDTGNYIIQEGHIPTVLLLATDDELMYKPMHQKARCIDVVHGVVHVTRTSVTVLVTLEE